jgi:hypothetical protein
MFMGFFDKENTREVKKNTLGTTVKRVLDSKSFQFLRIVAKYCLRFE